MSRASKPPRLARRLLERALPADVREHVTGDLEELFERWCTSHGPLRARLLYWREAVSFASRFLRERTRGEEVGSIAGARERARSRRGGGFSWLDVKLGVRMLVKYPGLSLMGAFGIAVAVALAASWFEFSHDMREPRVPFEAGERLVRIQNHDVAAAAPEHRLLHDFIAWRQELESFEDLAASAPLEVHVAAEAGRSATVRAARVSASLFALLRVAPVLGRPLLAADEHAGAGAAVVIGHDLWQRLFDGDPRVIGQTVRLGTTTSTVVGIMPPGFTFPATQEVWLPLREDPLAYDRREGPQMIVFGRLARGVTREEAQAELSAVGARMAATFPETHERLRPRVGPLVDLGDEALIASAADLAFIIVLLVVCATIATLVFARTATREGEIALRTALGASRRRIVLQLFTEGLVLTGLASAIGLAAAAWGLRWGMDLFWEVQQTRPPYFFDASLSLSTALYVAGLAIFGAAVIGVIPALKATGRRIQSQLSLLGSGGSRLRFGVASTAVIVVQVALCVAFLPFAIETARELLPDPRAAESGFRATSVLSGRLTMQVDEPPGTSATERDDVSVAKLAALQDEVRRRVAAEDGVSGVAFANRVPGMNHPMERMRIEAGGSNSDGEFDTRIRTLAVDPAFFEALGARVLAGRTFGPGDHASAVGVVVVGQSFARNALRERNAVGQRVRYPDRAEGEAERWYEVIGVVEDPAIVAFGAGEYVGVYRPLLPGGQAAVQMFVQASSNPEALATRIRSTVESVDPALAVDELSSMEEIWQPVRRSDRFVVAALGAVGAIGLMLALAGVYALMSFTVAQRSREIAIRAALGARPRRLVAAVFSRALAQIGLGVVAGALLVSLALSDSPDGAKVITAVAAMVMGVGLLACVIPAARALRIDPAEVLKDAR